MSHYTPDATAPGAPRSGRGRGKAARADLSTERGLRERTTMLAVAPAGAVAALAGGAFAVSATGATGPLVWGAGVSAGVCCAAVLVAARRAAHGTADAIHRQRAETDAAVGKWINHLRHLAAEGHASVNRTVDQLRSGERPEEPPPLPEAAGSPHAFAVLEQHLRQLQHAAQTAVIHAGTRQQVDAFVNISRRLQILVTRALKQLDDAERVVEDPEHLDRLYTIDHLVTRVHRAVESLAVLGGAVPRHFTSPVPLATVLRQAVAEIEHYPRVRVLPPPSGYEVLGHSAVEIIHLIAELAENATKFSPPRTQVMIRTQVATSGVVVEIEDRGLGMSAEVRDEMNRLLAQPEMFDVDRQLQDGRTGLFVVAKIARRRGLVVQLQQNLYGGVQAVVVLSHSVLSDSRAPQPPTRHTTPEPPPEPSTQHTAPKPPPEPAASRAPAPGPNRQAQPSPPAVDHARAHEDREVQGVSTPPLPERPVQATPPAAAEDGTGRPRLAQRNKERRSHLTPELREQPPTAGHDHGDSIDAGLLARFTEGLQRAEEADRATPGPPVAPTQRTDSQEYR
ncbi:ATP-binding protein [Streptomyces violens]|uniref:ATP-binding protein n=1 Tax=Streptomyces violens TaxID=66377 RepID=UPI00068BFC8D|nr:ATP-binding protein [Streptomyces violens]